jgi:hypothetical protein
LGPRPGAIKSSRIPSKMGARNRCSPVTALYSISANTAGSTQVAFGFVTGIESGEVVRI